MSQGLDVRFGLLLVTICGLVNGLSRIDPLVSTKAGLIRGLRSQHGYASFLGVPYGMVDKSNPFGPSIPHPGFEDTFEAYESNVCPQISKGIAIGTLDCLTMNIYVPSIANSRNRLPVMVWIHGGAFVTGSAASQAAEPISLLKNDVIVVAINYRLGAYGFMCVDHPNVSGNQGLKDQVLALRWINENIEAFGGDAKQITVFGESAGGMSVNLHLMSSHEKLFQRAIIQSGPAVSPWVVNDRDNSMPLILAEELGFNTTDLSDALIYLSTIHPHLLVQLTLDKKYTDSEQSKTRPCIEKEFEGVESFLTDNPRNINSKKASSIPVIFGINSNEVAFQLGNPDLYPADFLDNYDIGKVLSLGFDFDDHLDDAVDDIKHFYIGDEEVSEDVKHQIIDFSSDFLFVHPTQRMVEQLLQNGAKTVYRYVFSYVGGRNYVTIGMKLNTTGAAHGDELGYLFDLEMFSGDIITPEDQVTIDRITTLWTNFAKYGDPTPQTSDLIPVKWEPITKTTQPYLDLNSELTLRNRPFHGRMAFWDLFYKVYGKYQK